MSRFYVAPARLMLGFASLLSVIPFTAHAESVIYSSLPTPLPPNVPSLGYEATSTSEFGNLVNFAGTDRNLTGVSLVLSNFAKESTYEGLGTSTGYNVPLTFNIYNVGAGNSVGSLIASQTITAFVGWRPEMSPSCPDDSYMVGTTCYHGIASVVNFSFSETLPDSVIYGLAYNTQDYGYTPTHVDGPYNSLNFGLSTLPPSVGTNGSAYSNSNYISGSGGPGVYSPIDYSPYSGAVEFTAVPEPGSVFLMGIGLALVVYSARKRLIA